MKRAGNIFFILISLFFQNNAFSQDSRVSEAIKNADYIFKGKVLEIHPIKKLDGKDYISYKIVVEEKYKSDKKLDSQDTVELVTTLPFGWYIMNDGVGKQEISVYDIYYPENKGMGISIGIGGIFFAQNNNTSLSIAS